MEWTPENVAKFWDYTSQFPELYFTYRCGDVVAKHFRKYLRKSSNVLDYGRGTGFLIPRLLEFDVNVVGLDFSDKSIESVNVRFNGAPHFKGAFQRDELFKKGLQFDVIFLLEVIEHLDDEYLSKTFSDLKYFASKNGVIIITTPNNEKLEDNHIFCPQCEHVYHRWQHVRNWDEQKLRSYVENQGFHVVELYATDFVNRKNKTALIKSFAKRMLRRKPSKLVCVCKIKP